MQSASNIAASAKAGMDKTTAVVQEKAEKLTSKDPLQKQVAQEKKEAKMEKAERMKSETRAQNEAARHGGTTAGGLTTGTYGTTGLRDPTTGTTTGDLGTGTATGDLGTHLHGIGNTEVRDQP